MTQGSPAASMKEALDRIQQTLDVLVGHMQPSGNQTDQQTAHNTEMVRLVVEGYSVVQEAVETLHAQGQVTERLLRQLTQGRGLPDEAVVVPPPRRWRWYGVGIIVLSLGLGGGGWWWGTRAAAQDITFLQPYRDLSIRMHDVLKQGWDTLPKEMQDQVTRAYVANHMQAPVSQKGRK